MNTSEMSLPPFYSRYADLVAGAILTDTLASNGKMMHAYVSSWTNAMCVHRYAPEKWSAREVILHLTDAERIFAYRALRFSRGDQTPLPGFDENMYASSYKNDKRSMKEIINEMVALRASTIALFNSFSPNQLKLRGQVSGLTMSVQKVGEILAGHELHHKRVLDEKYFPK